MRSIFHATGAFLGRVESETRCAFWSDEPDEHGFDPALLVSVDLARSPSAASSGAIPWDAVEVDDSFTGPNGALSGTTLGPRWPELSVVGIVLLEERFARSLPERLRPPCPPTGMPGRAYEYTSVVYWPHTGDPRAGRRYAGHHAVIVEERGTLARLDVYARGAAANAAPSRMWIDLASPEECDAGPDSVTGIGVGDAPKEGAVFLISGRI